MSISPHVLLIENTIGALCYGTCLTLSLTLFRTLLISPYITSTPGLPRKKRLILFGYTTLLIVLASTFFPFPLYERARHLDGYRARRDGRRIEPDAWIPGTWEKLDGLAMDALACFLLQYLVYLVWHENGFVMGASLVILLLHLIGSPLIFETATSLLALIALIATFRTSRNPSSHSTSAPTYTSKLSKTLSFISLSFISHSPKKIPHTFTFVTVTFASLVWLDTILHLAGVLDDSVSWRRVRDPGVFHPVDFMRPLLYLGAFLVQALVILYWTEGGKMFVDESADHDPNSEGRILLREEEMEN